MFPSPHDFMTAYTKRYTPREVFPVVDTELGRIGMIACGEILVPEVSRIMMMQGAEVILHPTNSMKSLTDDAAKIARSTENKFYFVSANVAGPIGFSVDRREPGGRSRIIDFEGNVLAFDETADEGTVSAMIDVERLRSNRLTDVGPSGILRARWEMYRPFFAAATAFPPDSFLETPMANVEETKPGLEVSRSRFINVAV
jgi:predicted amidohydrolase